MKRIKNNLLSAALGSLLAAGMASCASESPFDGNGEALVVMNVTVDSRVTRVDNEDALRENCVIYVSKTGDKGGLLHKWKGVDNIQNPLYLKYGSYVAEAWAGDSVSASFDKKFFYGRVPFDVNGKSETLQVDMKCRIANVVASIEQSTIDTDWISDLRVVISHDRDSLVYEGETLYNRGYFMMPNGCEDLQYEISGKNLKANGKSFTKSGTIAGVSRAHEYRLEFSYDPTGGYDDGGAFLHITILEENLIEDDIEILGAPVFAWMSSEPELGEQIIWTDPLQENRTLRVAAFKGLKSLEISTDDTELAAYLGDRADMDYEFISGSSNSLVVPAVFTSGISVTKTNFVYDGYDVDKYFMEFSSAWLNSLPARDNEYVMTVTATDLQGRTSSTLVRIARSVNAIKYSDAIIADVAANVTSSAAIDVTYATIAGSVKLNGVTAASLEYRKAGTSEWHSASLSSMAQGSATTAYLTGLEGATAYEYRYVTDVNGEHKVSETINTFTTKSAFVLPNASMEEWSNFSGNSKVLIPAAGGVRSFWDTGNHGSSTMSVNITNYSDAYKHSGSYSAELKSQFVGMGIIGKFAAGNIFAGEYAETKGTNGVINFGRPYNGTHPAALKLYARYVPGTQLKGNGKAGNETVLTDGQPDWSQIYVAFTTGVVKVDTSDTSTLFNPDADYVVGYGQVSWHENFGGDGMAEAEININWKNRTTVPTHVIIVCSASKYGDYFTGCEGSVMYVDDFELVY